MTLEFSTLVHRETYITDARKTEKDKLKTVLTKLSKNSPTSK